MTVLSLAEQRLLAWQTLGLPPCGFCGETPGHRCLSASGDRVPPHKARMDALTIYLLRQPEVDGLLAQVASLRASNDQLVATLKTSDDKLDVAVAQIETQAANYKSQGADLALALQSQAKLKADLTHAQADLTAANAKIAALEAPPKPVTRFGFWPGGSASTPKDENGDKKIDWFDDYTRVVSYLGRPDILRNFQGGSGLGVIPASFAGTRPQVLGIKAYVESYSKVALADWISGKAGDLLAAYLDSVPADTHVYFDPHHEPYPEWTTAQIVQVWTKVLSQVPKKPNLHPTSIPMGYDLAAKRYSEDTLVDGIEVLAPDLYLTHGTLADVFEPMHDIAVKHGLGFGVSECAKAQTFVLPGMSDDQTSVALVDYLKGTVAAKWGAAYITLFESNKSDGNWLLQDDTTAVSAWVAR